MPTYYDILQVSRNAPIEVIKAAYRALVLKYHPDVNNSPEAKQKMAIIQQAYETLSDPIKRAEYDKKNRTSRRRRGNEKTLCPNFAPSNIGTVEAGDTEA